MRDESILEPTTRRTLAFLRARGQGAASVNRMCRELSISTGMAFRAVRELERHHLAACAGALGPTTMVHLAAIHRDAEIENNPPGGSADFYTEAA